MSAVQRRPQPASPAGTRVVLVIPRPQFQRGGQRALESALAGIERAGWHLVGVIDPDDYLEALRMVFDGLADVVLATRAEYVPALRILSHDTWFDTALATPARGLRTVAGAVRHSGGPRLAAVRRSTVERGGRF